MDNLELDTSFALNIFAILFFIISVIYFSAEVVFQLSPLTKSFLLISMTSIIIAAGIKFSNKIWSILAYITGFISYIIFLSYSLAKFSPGREVVFASLLGSAILFSALGSLISKKKLKLDFKRFKIFAAAVLLIAGGLTAFDMTGPEADYNIQLEDSIQIQEGENQLGTVKVENRFLLPRDYEVPDYRACGPENRRQDIHLDVASYETDSGTISGRETKKFGINYTAREMVVKEDENSERELAISGNYKVRSSDKCPADRENRTIYIFEDDEDRYID